MDLQAVLVALVAAAENVDNGLLKVIGLPYNPPAVEPPCVFVSEVVPEFDLTMRRGVDRVTVTLTLVVPRTDDQEGFSLLMAMLAGSGPASLKAALEAARGAPGASALGGACDDFQVKSVTGLRRYPFGEKSYLGADFVVVCIGSGG